LLLSLAACGTSFGRGVLPANDAAIDGPPGMADGGIDSPPYTANAVEFDTAGNDYMTGGNIGATDSASGTFSAWLRFHAPSDNAAQDIVTATIVGYGGGVVRTNTGHVEFLMRNCVGGVVLDVQTQNPYTTTSGWVHVLASWDLIATRADIYIGENEDRAVGATLSGNNICYNSVSWAIGGVTSGVLDADVADLYVDLGTFTDFTDPNNRRRFSTVDGKPVSLGASCTAPAGHQPIMCFTSAPATWGTNSGSGGSFTINGDGLTAAPTSP
jgi:hypothetical protein